MNMTSPGQKIYSFLANTVLLLVCVLSGASCERRAVMEEDIRRNATVRVIEEVMPSVVNIATAKKVDYEDINGGLFPQYFQTPQDRFSIGSGVIIDEAGYILTSFHVVPPRVSRIQVKLWNGHLYECDPIVATSYSDVALLKIHLNPGEKLKAIKFAQDDDVLQGETVLALGDPLGLGGTVTKGILSSKVRRLPIENGPLDYPDWLQTDAAINEGNSGGPLMNLRGELIGLNVAFITNSPGIGFAIPVKQVQAAMSQFFTPEVMNATWFGARVKADNGPLRVYFVQTDGPAEKAGLRLGDEILQVNGQTPGGVIQFNRTLCGPATNQNLRATLLVQRKGGRRTVNVQMVSFENLFREKLGLKLLKLTPEKAVELKVPANSGLYIEKVEADSPAGRAQLQEGFLLAGMDNQPVNDLLSAASILSAKKKGDHVTLTLVVKQTTSANSTEFRQGTVDVLTR